MFSIHPLVSYILAWGGCLGLVWVLFNAVESAMGRKGHLKHLGQWLKNQAEKDSDHSYWLYYFIALFDCVFGERHFTWRCFGRSAIASVAVFVTIYSAFYFPQFSLVASAGFPLGVTIIFFVLVNILGDFFSLLVTRGIVNKIAKVSALNKVLLLVFDFMATYVIFILFLNFVAISYLSSLSIDVPIFGQGHFLDILSAFFVYGIYFFDPDNGLFSAFLYTTYFTSVWLYLFLIGSAIIKIFTYATRGFNRTISWFDVEHKPLSTLGIVVMMVVTALFLIVPLIRWVL